MKKIKLVLTIITLLVVSQTHAQFWKKIGKKVEEAADKVVERKVEEKTEKETEKVFDSAFNNQNDKKLFKSKKVKAAAKYTFTHKYVMQITTKKKPIEIIYYLTNDHQYMGSTFKTKKNQEFITVMDLPNTAIHTFMDLGGQKSMTSFKIDLDDVEDTENDTNGFTIAPTGQTKKIIGYECEEFQVTGPKLSGKVWLTKEADISFQKAFNQLKTKQSKGFSQEWISMMDGLVLEMNMVDYSKRKSKTVKMICTSLNENDFIIETAQYKK